MVTDLETKTVYELKPNNARARRLGREQLKKYVEELEKMPEFKGIKWNTELDAY